MQAHPSYIYLIMNILYNIYLKEWAYSNFSPIHFSIFTTFVAVTLIINYCAAWINIYKSLTALVHISLTKQATHHGVIKKEKKKISKTFYFSSKNLTNYTKILNKHYHFFYIVHFKNFKIQFQKKSEQWALYLKGHKLTSQKFKFQKLAPS